MSFKLEMDAQRFYDLRALANRAILSHNEAAQEWLYWRAVLITLEYIEKPTLDAGWVTAVGTRGSQS